LFIRSFFIRSFLFRSGGFGKPRRFIPYNDAMAMSPEHVTIFSFAVSYAFALAFDLWNLFRSRLILRVLSASLVGAGLVFQLAYLVYQPWSLKTAAGSLLFLAFILAIFALYGSLHHQRVAWGLFVLPLVLVLVLLAWLKVPDQAASGSYWEWLQGPRFWGMTHGILVLLALVGVCVGFLASVMYFVQMGRLRSKSSPLAGVKLMSLERLEAMNRRAILWAFPLLTLGLIVGLALMVHEADGSAGWLSPKILSALALWIVFAILLYLRYGAHVRGRRLALLTIVAFAVMMIAVLASHPGELP
jgi:ABC-type transport system involved in cytochrome c biogenesis permease subunit